jgi:hypothetical protein
MILTLELEVILLIDSYLDLDLKISSSIAWQGEKDL